MRRRELTGADTLERYRTVAKEQHEQDAFSCGRDNGHAPGHPCDELRRQISVRWRTGRRTEHAGAKRLTVAFHAFGDQRQIIDAERRIARRKTESA